MNKRELVLEIAGRTGMEPEAVVGVVDALVDTVAATVAGGERVVIQGFGTFVRQPRARRVARDINADRRVVVPATHVPVFRAGKRVYDPPPLDAVLRLGKLCVLGGPADHPFGRQHAVGRGGMEVEVDPPLTNGRGGGQRRYPVSGAVHAGCERWKSSRT